MFWRFITRRHLDHGSSPCRDFCGRLHGRQAKLQFRGDKRQAIGSRIGRRAGKRATESDLAVQIFREQKGL